MTATRPRRHIALRVLILAVMAAAMVVSAGALRADADQPRTTYTASATQLVITYSAGADSIDVNVRYPDGTSFNYHPNRAAAVGEVLTLPLTGLPAWVQVHSTNCHLGEPGSPGYGIDCRFIEEEPCPTKTTPSSPEPTSPEPSPTPTPTSDPTPTPSESGPSSEPGTPQPEPSSEPTSPSPLPSDPEPSESPTSPVTSPTPVNTDRTPTSSAPDESTTTPTFRAEVSAIDDDVPAGMNHAVLAATGLPREWVIYGAVIAVCGIAVGGWLIRLVRPKRGDE